MNGRIKYITYMNNNVKDHVDPLTGEVDATGLAEDAAWHFGTEPDDDVFEWAFEVAERYEIRTGVRPFNFGKLSGLINSIQSDFDLGGGR